MPIKYIMIDTNIQATEMDDATFEMLDSLDAERKPQWLPNDDPAVITFIQSLAEDVQKGAILAVKFELQSEIDKRAIQLGFSSGNALMLYAGFTNSFKAMALKFAQWEATVWTEAEAYKAQALAGTAPMLTPQQAVAMMPTYPA